MSATKPRRWTAAEVRRLIDESPSAHTPRYELIDGELLVTPAPALRHQYILRWLFERLHPYLKNRRLGELFWSPADIELKPESVTQPDLFVVPGSIRARAWGDVKALLLAIEALSPSTARYDRIVKRRYYQSAGVPEYWIVDADARLVERWRPHDSRPEILTDALQWHPSVATEALVLDLAELWTEIAED